MSDPDTGTTSNPNGKKRILVVDDYADAADILAETIQELGHEVRIARDGREALAIVDEYRPHMVLLDIGLPGMDGYEVAHELRARGHTQALLVALTGYGQDSDRRRSIEAGFDHHVVKPIKLATILSMLEGGSS